MRRDWTATDVKAKLRGRHPATQTMGFRQVPGAWTCIEEWAGIDLLAFCVHASPASGCASRTRYPRVGYEVKVSRSDYRAEIGNPYKRSTARAMCHEFYFAVPAGLLKPEEIERRGSTSTQLVLDGPGLWVPDDVGLITVDGRGCKVRHASPVVKDPEPPFYGERGLHDLIRWVSARPDPRHEGVVEGARQAIGAQRRELQGALPQSPAPTEEAA
jgi:hypothetical protein